MAGLMLKRRQRYIPAVVAGEGNANAGDSCRINSRSAGLCTAGLAFLQNLQNSDDARQVLVGKFNQRSGGTYPSRTAGLNSNDSDYGAPASAIPFASDKISGVDRELSAIFFCFGPNQSVTFRAYFTICCHVDIP